MWSLFSVVVIIPFELFRWLVLATITAIPLCSSYLWATFVLMTFWLSTSPLASWPLCRLNRCLFLSVKIASSSFFTKVLLIYLSIASWLASKFLNSSMVGWVSQLWIAITKLLNFRLKPWTIIIFIIDLEIVTVGSNSEIL